MDFENGTGGRAEENHRRLRIRTGSDDAARAADPPGGEALEQDWAVNLVAMPGKPTVAKGDGSKPPHAAIRQLALRPLRRILLDRWEPWSARNLLRWHPQADAALLIAAPWSPVVYASRHLVAAGIPYVMDVGDPWALTWDVDLRIPIGRARKAERFLWEHAAGAVVTTEAQRDRLQELFPALPMLVRPNGFNPIDALAPEPSPPDDDSSLKIAHFGLLAPDRLDVVRLLTELSRSGRWKSILFSQFGNDVGIGLDQLSVDSLRIQHNASLPWEEAAERAWEFDAVLAIAYPHPVLLPSKTIEYSSLPLPRIALTNPDPDDALRQYANEHTGWLAVSNDEAGIGDRVWEHVNSTWSPAELAPSPDDAWPAVADQVARFVDSCVAG